MKKREAEASNRGENPHKVDPKHQRQVSTALEKIKGCEQKMFEQIPEEKFKELYLKFSKAYLPLDEKGGKPDGYIHISHQFSIGVHPNHNDEEYIVWRDFFYNSDKGKDLKIAPWKTQGVQQKERQKKTKERKERKERKENRR